MGPSTVHHSTVLAHHSLVLKVEQEIYPSSQTNIAADTTGHLAVALFQDVEPPCDGVVGPLQLASYTVDTMAI